MRPAHQLSLIIVPDPLAGVIDASGGGRRFQAVVRLGRGKPARAGKLVETASVAFTSYQEALVKLAAHPVEGTELRLDVWLVKEQHEAVIAKLSGTVVGYTPAGECVVTISSRSRIRRTTF